jgi:hypothetical protein
MHNRKAQLCACAPSPVESLFLRVCVCAVVRSIGYEKSSSPVEKQFVIHLDISIYIILIFPQSIVHGAQHNGDREEKERAPNISRGLYTSWATQPGPKICVCVCDERERERCGPGIAGERERESRNQ